MTKLVYLAGICLALSCAGLTVSFADIVESERDAQMAQSSKYIVRGRISETVLSNTSSTTPMLLVNADVEILDVIKSDSSDKTAARARLLYTIDEASPPRVRVGDLVTVYAVDSRQKAFLEPIHIVLEERGMQQQASIGQSVVLEKGEWATVHIPDSGETTELLYLGVGRSHCPPGPNGERGGLCATVRTQLLWNGQLINFQNYPTTPPIRLVEGLSVQVLSDRGKTSESGIELRVIGQDDWQELWATDSQDLFSYGCGGGITGGYSRTEILRDGRITEVSSPTFSGQQLSASVETGQWQVADQIFGLLESIDQSKIDMDVSRESFSCSYEVRLGATSLNFLASDENPPEIELALEQARKALTNKDQRVINSL